MSGIGLASFHYSLGMASTVRTKNSADANTARVALESSDWARSFRTDAPVSYREGIEFAMEVDLRVFLKHTEENGEPQWAICVEERPEFWMDALETRAEAVALCKAMGWKLVRP